MSYTETTEKSAEILRMALQKMGQLSIPVNPVNYAIWYDYFSGMNHKLTKAIDELQTQKKEFTPEVCDALYKKFISLKKLSFGERTILEIRKILFGLLKNIKTTGGEVSHSSGALQTYSQQLDSNVDLDSIKDIVGGIIIETKKVIESSEKFKMRLHSSTREVDILKEELESIKEKAYTDQLTGLANRSAFEAALLKEIKRCESNSEDLCMLFADIDHFKRFNDTYGHLVGDMVLRMAAAMIKGSIKGRDTAARYGGEEFVVILPGTQLEGAKAVAEQIRAFFEAKKWKQKDTGRSIGAVTISLGVAQYRHGETPASFIKRADEALYFSKNHGRNKVSSEIDL